MNKLKFLLFVLSIYSITSCGIFKKKTAPVKPTTTSSSNILIKYEKIIGVKLINEKLYSVIDQWVGVPYRYSGKSKSGIDCSNFTCQILRDVFQFPSSYYFSSAKLAEQGKKINLENAKEGDVVFFAMSTGSKISHVGVYLVNNKFVHASTSKGVIISSLTEEYYKTRYVGVYRLNK